MRHKLSLLILTLVLGTATSWAGPPPTDAQTTDSLHSHLDRTVVTKHGDVQVTYAGGVATLSGSVDNLGSKLDIEKSVRKTKGVTQVVDNIQIRADDATNEQILARARHEIVMYYAYGIFDNIELAADNGTLVVSGQVTQPFKKSDIGNFLTRVKGVAAVQNDLEVLPVSNFDDRLRLQVARAIYSDPYFLHYANQAQPPIHIVVKNGYVTLEGVVASNMDRNKANMDALSAGLSFSVVDKLRIVQS